MYSGNQASYENLSENMKQKLEELKTPVVNDLTTGGSDKALSAESGKELKSLVDDKADGEDLESLQTEVTEHLADDTSHTEWIETVGGTANALTVTLDGLTSYKNGLGVSFPVKSNSTAAMSLNINGLGAIPIKKANGTPFSNGISNGVYTVRYRDGAFILQGESEVEVGKQIITPNTVNQTITQGVHDGTGYVVGSPNLVSQNIKKGVTMFNVTGTFEGEMSGTATEYIYPITTAVPKDQPFHTIDMSAGWRIAHFIPDAGPSGERDMMNGGAFPTFNYRSINQVPYYGTDATLHMIINTDVGSYTYSFPQNRKTTYMPQWMVLLSGTSLYLRGYYEYDKPDGEYQAKASAYNVYSYIAGGVNKINSIQFKMTYALTNVTGTTTDIRGTVYKIK